MAPVNASRGHSILSPFDMPNWIEYFDTDELVLTDTCLDLLILEDGTVVIMGR